MPNKLFLYPNTASAVAVAAAAVGRQRVYNIVLIFLIFGFLFMESCAFYSIGVHLDFNTGNFREGRSLIAITTRSKTSTRTAESVTTLMNRGRMFLSKSDYERPSSSCADSRQIVLQKTQTNKKSSQGRRKGRSRRQNRHQTKFQAAQNLVPHSGRHFFPSHPAYRRPYVRLLFWKLRKRKRFMEGWYYRLTLKNYEIDGFSNSKPVSFAFIISIEDPGIASSDLRLACLQAIGPNDQYLVQSTKDDTKFWASKKSQSLGCTFEENYNYNCSDGNSTVCRSTITELDADVWNESVRSGFQIIGDSSLREAMVPESKCEPRWMGRILGHDGSKGGVLDGQGVQGKVEFDFVVDSNSVCGYGGYTTSTTTTGNITAGAKYSTRREIAEELQRQKNHDAQRQKSTGGWLSSFPVFEPHWQVTIADALASGSVDWNGTQYKFKDQPFYAEKNWGDALPSKWYWTQCNSFDNYEGELSVTAGGGIRKLPFGKKEDLGMIAIHHKGRFYEAVPWKGNVEWNVSTWGEWSLYGDRLEETINHGLDETTPPFAVEIRYRCDPEKIPGLVFRAPTPNHGMVPFCRDTFEADCELTLWTLKRNEITNEFEKVEPPIIDRATSKEGGAEVGGGPWWSEWRGKSELKPVVKALLNFPKNLLSKSRRSQRGHKMSSRL
jgi:tocopherol cyclase